MMTQPKISRQDRKAMNAIASLYGWSPVKERRAPRARVYLYTVISTDESCDCTVKTDTYTMADARRLAKSTASSRVGGVDWNASICRKGDEDMALEIYCADGRVIK